MNMQDYINKKLKEGSEDPMNKAKQAFTAVGGLVDLIHTDEGRRFVNKVSGMLASIAKTQYSQLINAGFSEEQALRLTEKMLDIYSPKGK